MQKNKTHKKEQDCDTYEHDIREYQAQKCWVMTKKSNNNAALKHNRYRKSENLWKKASINSLTDLSH